MSTCVQCNSESKYKCPICRQPYCSIACCKQHKMAPCTAPAEPEELLKESSFEYDFPTADTVAIDKLKLLESSEEVKKCLENPHVRQILLLLDQSSHPDELMQEYMQEPIFTEFVDACLNIVQPPDDNSTV